MRFEMLRKGFLSQLGGGRKVPYQTFLVDGVLIRGRVDTPRMYYSFDLSGKISGLSWLDLGCNEGSLCLLAKQDGAENVVGVEIAPERVLVARTKAAEFGIDVRIEQGDIVEYVGCCDRFDVVSLMAMVRHVHAEMMRAAGHEVKRGGVPYLIYDSFHKLILGHNNPVRDQFNEFMSRCIDRAKKYFLCSINDHSGLIIRRQSDVCTYFKSLTDRIDDIEIYKFSEQNDGYAVIRLTLREPAEHSG